MVVWNQNYNISKVCLYMGVHYTILFPCDLNFHYRQLSWKGGWENALRYHYPLLLSVICASAWKEESFDGNKEEVGTPGVGGARKGGQQGAGCPGHLSFLYASTSGLPWAHVSILDDKGFFFFFFSDLSSKVLDLRYVTYCVLSSRREFTPGPWVRDRSRVTARGPQTAWTLDHCRVTSRSSESSSGSVSSVSGGC